MSGSPGLNPSDAVAQPSVDNRAGDDLPGGDVDIAFGKNIKPASRGEGWIVFHDGRIGALCPTLQSNVSRGVPMTNDLSDCHTSKLGKIA